MASTAPIKTLLITKTCAYRHACIPATTAAIASLPGILVRATEDASILPRELPLVDVLILGHNSGDFLDAGPEQDAVRAFVARGGGVVGVHAATVALTETAWYGELLGGVFDRHPPPQWGVVIVDDTEHFITHNLPLPLPSQIPFKAPPCPPSMPSPLEPTSSTTLSWFDEWYNFKMPLSQQGSWPMPGTNTLCSVDEATYEGGKNGPKHPLVWCREADGGSRMFYTALGHFDEMYHDPWFMTMLDRGIRWAARRDGDGAAS